MPHKPGHGVVIGTHDSSQPFDVVTILSSPGPSCSATETRGSPTTVHDLTVRSAACKHHPPVTSCALRPENTSDHVRTPSLARFYIQWDSSISQLRRHTNTHNQFQSLASSLLKWSVSALPRSAIHARSQAGAAGDTARAPRALGGWGSLCASIDYAAPSHHRHVLHSSDLGQNSAELLCGCRC